MAHADKLKGVPTGQILVELAVKKLGKVYTQIALVTNTGTALKLKKDKFTLDVTSVFSKHIDL